MISSHKLAWFRATHTKGATGLGDTDTVRRIVDELDPLEPLRARYLAPMPGNVNT